MEARRSRSLSRRHPQALFRHRPRRLRGDLPAPEAIYRITCPIRGRCRRHRANSRWPAIAPPGRARYGHFAGLRHRRQGPLHPGPLAESFRLCRAHRRSLGHERRRSRRNSPRPHSPRHRQGGHPRNHPQQGRPAQSRRVGNHEVPRPLRRKNSRALGSPRPRPRDDPPPPRILRRLGLSGRYFRGQNSSRRAHSRHRRRLRHHHQRPHLQKSPPRRRSPRRTRALQQRSVRRQNRRALRPDHAPASQSHHRIRLHRRLFPQLLVPFQLFGTNLSRIAQRQWWLWSSAFLVTILLALCIASFAFPGLLAPKDVSYAAELNIAVRGLVGLVLLFNVYTVYQQLQIYRIQNRLSDQLEAMSKIEVRTEEVYKIAVLDALTGLYNRLSGKQRLAEEISRSQRHARPLTLLLLDLNGLKNVNDMFGHPAGDEVIKTFAERLKQAIRGSDVAIRLGGDEVLAVLPECKPEEVRHVLGRLTGIKTDWNGQSLPITFSSGWTNFKPGESLEDLVKRPDDPLHVNKRAGREQAHPTPPLT